MMIAMAALAACENESYESGTGSLSLTTADFVEVYTDGSAAVSRVVTDDGEQLSLSHAPAAEWINRPDTVYRAVLYYDRTADEAVSPVSVVPVPVLRPVPAAQFEAIRTDPVRFESLWASAGGRYINIGIYLKNGTTGDADSRHTVGIILDGVTRNADGTSTARLRLYHDQGGVPEYYSTRYYISIPGEAVGADSAAVTIATYDGAVERRVRLK